MRLIFYFPQYAYCAHYHGKIGQSSSSQRKQTLPWPEIQSLEQFKAQFRREFIRTWAFGRFLSAEVKFLDAVADKFGTSKEGLAYWSESTITVFLAITLPEELQLQLKIASPPLYRSALRLGSFPYLNHPEPSLTNDVLFVALSFLLQRHGKGAQPVGMSLREGASGAPGMCSLLFQSIRLGQDTTSASKEARAEQDDTYLLQAHDFVAHHRCRRPESNPTIIEIGPPIISAEELPSSNSADYSGAVPRDQFNSLVQICLCLNRHSKGSNSSMDEEKLPSDDEDIRWDVFEAYFGSAKPPNASGLEHPLLNGLFLLLSPFVSLSVDTDSLKSATRAEAEEILYEARPPNLKW